VSALCFCSTKGGNLQDVALCVCGSPEMDAQLVLKGIQQVYTRAVLTKRCTRFFVSPEQRVSIARVPKAFYRSPTLK
jgi:hypothetical protein